MIKKQQMIRILHIYKFPHKASFFSSIQLCISQANYQRIECCRLGIAHRHQRQQYHHHFLSNIGYSTNSYNFIVLYQRMQKNNSKSLSNFQIKFQKKIIFRLELNKLKTNPSKKNKKKGKKLLLYYQVDRKNKRIQTVNISSQFIDYKTLIYQLYLFEKFLQVTTLDNTMSANTTSDKIYKKTNQLNGTSSMSNPGTISNFQKGPNSNYQKQVEQLKAIKQRVKVRNINKQNNPLYQSQNLFNMHFMKRNLDQPIKEKNYIHLTEKQVQLFSINDFQIGDLLGRGAEARVRIAFHKPTGAVFSIKTLLRRKVQQKIDIFIRSLKIQMFVNHPNIAKIYGIIIQQKEVHLIMEYCADGDFSMNRNMFGKQNKNIKSILYKISQAVQYLHTNRIQHRDLKLQNILLNYGVPKITDFELSVYTRLDFFPRKTICGTPAYFSPEMVGKHKYNKKADIWCLGIIFYELLCGYFPFQYKKMQDLQNISGKQLKQFPRTLSRMAADLINKMLAKQSQNRVSIQGILLHEFFLIQKKQ